MNSMSASSSVYYCLMNKRVSTHDEEIRYVTRLEWLIALSLSYDKCTMHIADKFMNTLTCFPYKDSKLWPRYWSMASAATNYTLLALQRAQMSTGYTLPCRS